MLRKFSVVAAVLVASFSAAAQQQAVTPVPDAVGVYAKVLSGVEAADAPTTMEPLFHAGEEAQNALMRIEGDAALLEKLTEAQFADTQKAMRGYQLSRGYDIYALPNLSFFVQLANTHGKPEDQRFYRLARQSEGENFLPLYLKEKIPTPCVRFGERLIGELYEGWSSYARSYPKAYSAAVQQYLRDLEEAVALGTCACGDAKSVQTEQREFLRRFPKNPMQKEIRLRMLQINKDPEVQPVNCR